MGSENIEVGALRHAHFFAESLEGQRGGRANIGVLQHDRVAQNQVRTDEASDLVPREIPRHDAQQRAGRALTNPSLAIRAGQWFVRQELCAVVRVVFQDLRGVDDFRFHFGARFPHFFAGRHRVLLAAIPQSLG